MGHKIVGIASRPTGHRDDRDRGDFVARPVRELRRPAQRSAGATGRAATRCPDHPFRGEYYELTPEASSWSSGLIYPVPDPAFPFLGVHLTRMINGWVHAGPNAILALAREGYTKLKINPRDVADSLRWPGLWRLGKRYWRTGFDEAARSLSRKRFCEPS